MSLLDNRSRRDPKTPPTELLRIMFEADRTGRTLERALRANHLSGNNERKGIVLATPRRPQPP